MRNIVYLCLFALILFACAGEESTNVDTTPPQNAILFEHLGDTGDGKVFVEQLNDSLWVDDSNNGIDAVPIGDKIRLNWDHVAESDLKMIRIFRYSQGYTPVQIDSIAPSRDSYEDNFTSVGDLPVTETQWFYFIQLLDQSGNYSISDTVSYRLIDKAILSNPTDNAVLINSNITFSWYRTREVDMFRLLIFDENENYVWHRDLNVSLEGNFIQLSYNGDTPLPPGTYYWRVDAFRDKTGPSNSFVSGSESNQRVFIIQ